MACEVCNDSGWLVYDVPYDHPQFGRLCSCPVCGPRRAAERAGQEREKRMSSVVSELGGRLARCSFDNFDTSRPIAGPVRWGSTIINPDQQRTMLKEALGIAQSYALRPGRWLYIYGTYGSGKSHLAAAIANQVARDMRATYSTTATVWNWLRAGYKENDFEERLASLCEVDFLVLDDVGADRHSDFVDETLFSLLNARYNHELPTVLTSNEAMSALPGRVQSRVVDLAREVPLIVSDYRQLSKTG